MNIHKSLGLQEKNAPTKCIMKWDHLGKRDRATSAQLIIMGLSLQNLLTFTFTLSLSIFSWRSSNFHRQLLLAIKNGDALTLSLSLHFSYIIVGLPDPKCLRSKSRIGFSKVLIQTRFSGFSSTNGGTSKSQKPQYFRITFCQGKNISKLSLR